MVDFPYGETTKLTLAGYAIGEVLKKRKKKSKKRSRKNAFTF